MTDGQNNAGKVPPLTAAEAAQALGVKVYTIGVGTRGFAPMPARDAFGRKVYVRQAVDIDEDTLKKIAHELVEIVRRDAKTDWSVKEQVRAKLRATIKRLLLKYGYPPDEEPAATQLVLEQAEVIAGDELH